MIRSGEERSADIGLLPIGTAVVWLACVAVGITGILVPAIARAPIAENHSPIEATVIHVDLTASASPAASTPPQAGPPPVETAAPPEAPPLPVVATPTPIIAFALPTAAPAQTAAPADAVPTRSNANAAPAIQRIAYGVGEGQQPKPDYPIEAQIAREYGAIIIRFRIDQDGNVASAQIIKPCPYADLNQAALRGVRETWHFAPGAARVAETEIDYAPKKAGSP